MATSLTDYYGMIRLREMSPDARDWAVTDGNFQVLSKLLKAFEQHTHTAAVPFNYPGYNGANPAAPVFAVLTEQTTGGILTPGTSVGVRLAYQNSLGLETDAAPEVAISLASAVGRPNAPTQGAVTAVIPGLSGGTYVYVVTKKKGTGETLPSDILPVTIAYDQTYSVAINFNAINSYTDGTTAVNVYRATGLNAAFQLVATITSVSQTTYTDAGGILAGNEGVQPPSSSTFDASRKIRINWAAHTAPTGATKLRVYVTQQTGIWGNNCLLSEFDIPGLPTFVDYLGSESLAAGSPLQASQLPASPPKINLGTQATGAPTLTADMNFAGFQALNMKLHNNAGAPVTPTNGYIYYDTSIPTVRAYINGAWVNWGTTAATAYTHPAEEAGGHIAANIKFVTAGVTVKSILDRLADAAGAQKQVQTKVVAAGSTSTPSVTATASSTSVFVADMSLTPPAQQFAGQEYAIEFDCQLKVLQAGQTINLGFEIGGTLFGTSVRSFTATVNNQLYPIRMRWTTTSNGLVKVLWWVTSSVLGAVQAVGTQRFLESRLIF